MTAGRFFRRRGAKRQPAAGIREKDGAHETARRKRRMLIRKDKHKDFQDHETEGREAPKREV